MTEEQSEKHEQIVFEHESEKETEEQSEKQSQIELENESKKETEKLSEEEAQKEQENEQKLEELEKESQTEMINTSEKEMEKQPEKNKHKEKESEKEEVEEKQKENEIQEEEKELITEKVTEQEEETAKKPEKESQKENKEEKESEKEEMIEKQSEEESQKEEKENKSEKVVEKQSEKEEKEGKSEKEKESEKEETTEKESKNESQKEKESEKEETTEKQSENESQKEKEFEEESEKNTEKEKDKEKSELEKEEQKPEKDIENNTQIKKENMPEKEKEKEKDQAKKDTTIIEKDEKESQHEKEEESEKEKEKQSEKKEDQTPEKEEENKKTNKETTYEPKITQKIIVPTTIIVKTQALTDIPSDKSNNGTQLTRLKIESVNQEGCDSSGILSFIIPIIGEIPDLNKFTLPLINPEGITLSCQLKGIELKCETDRIINQNLISFGETIIKEEDKDLFIIESFSSKVQINCANALLEKTREKLSKNTFFRQVSHFKKDDKLNQIFFNLIAIVSQKYSSGYKAELKMNVPINNKINEKIAICTLENDVSPNNGEFVQANFLCSINLTYSEYINTDFEEITISKDNEEFNGLDKYDDIFLNPYKTDKEIERVKNKKQKGEKIKELENIIDYYEEEVKMPPGFTIDSIDMDQCKNEGIFKFTGRFSDEIQKSVRTDVFLNYPLNEAKCEFEETKKNNKKEMVCKVHEGFKLVEAFMLEQKLIKKKNKEMCVINQKDISFDSIQECCDYNTAKTPFVKNKIKSNYTFLQISKFKPIPNAFTFFMAITKKYSNVAFKKSHKLKTKLIYPSSRLLRNLDEVINNIEVKCDLDETLQTDYAAGYNCANIDNITVSPFAMKIISKSITDIQGIPEDADPNRLKYNIDYSNLTNLEQVANLPNAEINRISGENCSIDGQYVIYATLNKNENLLSNYSDVIFRISIPESCSICEVSIKNKNIVMICQNEDKFYNSKIIIERQTIQDSEGNELFFIEAYESSNEFACDISLLSSYYIPEDNNPSKKYHFYPEKDRSLSKEAIAAIVVVILVIIATLIGLVIFYKRKEALIKKKNEEVLDADSAVENFEK